VGFLVALALNGMSPDFSSLVAQQLREVL